MKKSVFLLTIILLLVFTACNRESQEEPEESEVFQPVVQTYQRVEEEEEPPTVEETFRKRLSVAYQGELEDGTTLYFSQSPDNALAVFLLISGEELLQGCAGSMTVSDNELAVVDLLSGEQVEFSVREDNGQLFLDMGGQGGAYLDYTSVDRVCDLLFAQVDYSQGEL